MYTMTPDRHFIIGGAPGTDARVVMACGFSGHGFKFAPVVGEILADLTTTGRTPWDISLFDPLRFGRPLRPAGSVG
jgi:sarcosine oxidase